MPEKRTLPGGVRAAVEIRLVPDDYVYVCRGKWWDLLGERQHHDTVIHIVAVINRSSEIITVDSLTFEGLKNNRVIQMSTLEGEEIQRLTEPVVSRVTLGLRKLVDLMLSLDLAVPHDMELSANTALAPTAAFVIPNVYLSFHSLPDTIKISMRGRDEGGNHLECAVTLPVVEYESKVTYAFPLEGRWVMKGMPQTGVLDHHRFGTSNEFGVDLLCLGPGGELFRDEGRLASDYYSYGAKVLTSADGKVAQVYDGAIQKWSTFNPMEGETPAQFEERQLEQVRQALQRGEILQFAAGNYVILQHPEGECSAYLHLKEDSIRVKVGETVSCGQHIADVGNTGDSFGAHLHFQVLDKPDMASGRSLPFSFKNIEKELTEPAWFVHANG